MKKFTFTCIILLLVALTFNSSAMRGFMGWMSTPVLTKAEIVGKDGAFTATAPNTVVNKYAKLMFDAPAGAGAITIENPGGANGLDPATLTPGDLLMIIQMAGATIDSNDGPNYGMVTSLNNAGRYEFVTVNQVDGNIVTLNPPCGGLRFSYTAAGKVQVIRVPQFTTLTVNAGASLTAPAWNGVTGGIVSIHVETNAVLNGTVDVSGIGFRGGALSAAGGGGFRSDYVSSQQDFGAEKGEGIAGYQTDYDNIGGRYGRGAAGNAGGGGTSHNTGGGGGANGSNGKVWTGQGVMDGAAVGGTQAWKLDPGYIANGNALTDSSGGGRGGYSYAVVNGDALTQGPGNDVWSGDKRREVGGIGGRPVPQDTAGRLFFGGGGGSGAQNNDSGGAGGNGGGMVFIIANSLSGSGMVKANGSNGGSTRNDHRDAPGGAGAGGTIVLNAQILSGVTAQANGGVGGGQSQPVPPYSDESEGPGGGGGGGFIAYSGGSIATEVKGGGNGVTVATAVAEFPFNGSTRGASGAVSSVITSIPFCSTTSDLSITKTNNSTSIVPGSPTTYTIIAKNNGPRDVFGIEVKDTLPAVFSNVTWTCVATTGSNCFAAAGAGNLDTRVNLLNGGAATFLITATPDPSATGSVTNTASIAPPAGAIDVDPSNNTAIDTDTFTPSADLSVAKTNGVTTVTAGTSTSYTIVVTNNGPSSVPSASVSDPAPAKLSNVTWTCVASAGSSCGAANGTGSIATTVSLLPGGTATFTVSGTVLASASGMLDNTVTVATPGTVTESNPTNNTAIDSDTILVTADLTIAKTNNATSSIPGNQTSYTVVATNNGPGAISGAIVTDTLPAQLTNASWTCTASAGSSCQAANGTGSLNTTVNLANNGTATFTVTATISATATGTLTNAASIATPTGATDPNPGNNTATDVDTLTPQADLTIVKTLNTNPVTAGAPVKYTIDVTNIGPSAAMGATVVDTLPPQMLNATWTCTATTGSSCGAANGSGNINATVNLLPAGKATFIIDATIATDATGSLVNSATVTSPPTTPDPNPGNGSSTTTNPIIPTADLRITKTASPSPVRASENVTYTLVVTNVGPSMADAVTVTDPLPDGLTFVSAASTKGTCSGTQTVTCEIGKMDATAPNNTATITIVAKVSPFFTPGPLANVATVASPTQDPVGNNNSGTTTVTVQPPPAARFAPTNISIRSSGVDVCIRGGNVMTYEIKLTNSGDGVQRDNDGPEFTALLPAQISTIAGSCTASGGACSIGSSSQVEWNGSVQPNQTVTIAFQFRIRQGLPDKTRFCTDFKVNYDTNNDGVNDATTPASSCLETNCEPAPCTGPDCPEVGPGNPIPELPNSTGSGQRPGSVLIFPIYISDPTNSNSQNTRISITNIDVSRPAYLHMFFVDGSTCSVADNYLCLTPNQTTSFLMSDLDPGVSGYLVAVAVDNNGWPIKFNYLIGDEYVKFSSGHAANLGAEAVPGIDVPAPTPTSNAATINFNGTQFGLLGRVLTADSVPSVADGNSTMLIVDRIGGDLSAGASTIGSMFGLLYNDAENAFSFNITQGACQMRSILSSTFPRTSPRFTEVVAAGRTGWLKVWLNTPNNEGGLIGATINFNPNTGGFRGGHNLHKLTLASSSLTIPVFAPSCQ
ncbi:MAG: DUF11 domain-containing protein [Blastocatellia bacterium]|nr:DUF11 domain-containing protein [Blastocatellia bacterium]